MSDIQWSWATGWDRRQNEAIVDLQYQAMHNASRIRAAQRETKKQFEKQISSVNTRLDTVMDWLDLRFAQLDFDEYGARREARNYFRALAAHDVVAIRELDDVPGYWLPPMAAPLAQLVLSRQNDRVEPFADAELPADIRASLEVGRHRDPVRSDLFILATSICFDLPTLRTAPAKRLLAGPMDFEFGEDPTLVARGWRTLWERVAHGDFGATVTERLVERLTEAFDPTALDDAAADSWQTAILRHSNGSETATLDADRALPVLLATLSERIDADATETAGTGNREVWQHCLQELVTEASEPERPLVAAMSRLRPQPGDADGQPEWRSRAGTVAALLRDDLLGDEVAAAQRRVALRVAGPYLRQRIAAVCEVELAAPEPTVAVKDGGQKLLVGPNGPDRAAYDKAVERRRRVDPVQVPPLPMVVGIIAVLLALAVLGAVNQAWVLTGVMVLLTTFPVWWVWGARAAARSSVDHAEGRVADLAAQVEKAAKQARVKRDEQRLRQERVRVVTAKLLAVLPEA